MKTTKLLIAAATLAVLPSLGFAMCSDKGHEDVVMSCADGMTYDAETGTCVTVTG